MACWALAKSQGYKQTFEWLQQILREFGTTVVVPQRLPALALLFAAWLRQMGCACHRAVLLYNTCCSVCDCALQAAGVNWAAVEGFMDMGGVRIEDNVVITAGGHFNLTDATGLPKTAAAIEAAMAEGRDAAAAAAKLALN